MLAGKASLTASENDYDWLGHGIYFWEHNAPRAYEFACEVRDQRHGRKRKLSRPAVVGAIIELGNCLNLLDSGSIQIVRDAYLDLVRLQVEAGERLPENSGGPGKPLRRLDCAVMEMLHTTREDRGEPLLNTVRAAFIEGGAIYDGAGFHEKTHIQVCVRSLSSIKGYFRPLDEDGRPVRFG